MLPTVRRRLQASLPLLNQSTPPPPRLDSLLLTIPPELDFSHLMKKASPGPENGYRPRGRNVMDGKALGDEGKKWIGKMKARPPGIGGEKKQMSGGEGEGRPRQDRREGQAQGQGPTQPRFQRQPRDQNQSFDRHPRNASFNNSNNRSNNQSRPQFQTKSASSSPTDAFSPASENANDARTPAPPKPRTYNQQRWKEDIDAARADGSQQPHKRSGMYQARGEQRGNRSENRDGSGSTGPEGKNNFSRDRTNNATSGKASRPLNRRNDRRQSSDTPAPVSVSSETDISRSLDKARMEPISEEELFGLGSSRSGGAGMTGKKEDFAVVESGRGEGVMKAKGAGESRAARTAYKSASSLRSAGDYTSFLPSPPNTSSNPSNPTTLSLPAPPTLTPTQLTTSSPGQIKSMAVFLADWTLARSGVSGGVARGERVKVVGEMKGRLGV